MEEGDRISVVLTGEEKRVELLGDVVGIDGEKRIIEFDELPDEWDTVENEGQYKDDWGGLIRFRRKSNKAGTWLGLRHISGLEEVEVELL